MEIKTLGELCNIVSGGTPLRSKPEYWNNGTIPWIKIGDMKGKYINNADECITQAGLDSSSAKMLPKGTILYTIFATLGDVGILEINASTNQAIAGLTIKDNSQILSEYLYYYLKSKKGYVKTIGRGVAQSNINMSILKSFQVPLPTSLKQKEIVDILDKITNIIKYRQQELHMLDNLIKARFVEMFGHQSHNEKSLPYMTIDDVAEIYLGITHTPTYVDSGVIFISAKNTSGDFLDLSDVKYISREEFEGAPKGSKPKANDVLFSRVRSNLGHPVILEEELELCTFVSLGFLRSKGTVTSNYLKHWMRDEFFARQVSEHVKGGGQPNLNTGWLKEFKIIVPDMDQQKKFDAFCCQIDKSKATVQKALDETQLLFDSLMQQYFG